jgi:hypothetical protein
MARLIVEEGGKRRAFRLGDGVLTVGSGSEARLKLASEGIAEIHAEIETRGEEALLRPRPGVQAPTVGGVPQGGEVSLEFGQAVEIGGARLWLEDESGSAPAPSTSAPAVPGGVASGAPRSGAERERRRQSAIQKASRAPRRSVVERTRPRVQRGLPAWAVVGGVLGAVGLTLLLLWKGFQSVEESTFNIDVALDRAEKYLEEGDPETAKVRIGALAGQEITGEQRERIRTLRARIAERGRQSDRDAVNAVGRLYWNTKLEKYEINYLQGSPDPSRIRLFLARCKYFRERWPDHPQLGWVTRQESRFQGSVDLSQPKTLADIQWEIRSLVRNSPRHYGEAFGLLDEFIPRATSKDLAEAETMRQEMIVAREEYALDRLQQAKYELEKKENPGGAVWWLINSVCYLGDPAMEDDAAGRLIRMSEIGAHLEGYRDERPDIFEELMKNSIVRGKAKKLGVY